MQRQDTDAIFFDEVLVFKPPGIACRRDEQNAGRWPAVAHSQRIIVDVGGPHFVEYILSVFRVEDEKSRVIPNRPIENDVRAAFAGNRPEVVFLTLGVAELSLKL